MKIGIFTSSRADYGIYQPLLKSLKADSYFDSQLLVFGTHLSKRYGYTIKQIETDGYYIGHRINTIPDSDTPGAIVRSMSRTQVKFSRIWEIETYDLFFALGDRYEMFAAVSSTVPFNIPVAHIHGGETTLGAFDNTFRNCITSMSVLHFTTCEEYKKRVIEITGSTKGVYNVGALSLDLLTSMQFLTIEEFYIKYKINLKRPTILFTFHPETISYEKNEEYIKILIEVLGDLIKQYQVVITMPNADTSGNIIRKYLEEFIKSNNRTFKIESFGSLGYLSCMKHCSFMLGNSSSGFVEASWFPKAVINVGERQNGRLITDNIINVPIEKNLILKAVLKLNGNQLYAKQDVYGTGNTSAKIIDCIKKFNEN